MVVEICKREAVHGSVGEPASLDNHTQYIIRDDHGRGVQPISFVSAHQCSPISRLAVYIDRTEARPKSLILTGRTRYKKLAA